MEINERSQLLRKRAQFRRHGLSLNLQLRATATVGGKGHGEAIKNQQLAQGPSAI